MGVCPVWRVKSVERGSLNFKTVLAPLGVTHTLVRSSAGPLLSPGLCGSQGATEQGAGAGRGEAKKPQTPGEALPPSPPLPASPGPTPALPFPPLLPSFPAAPVTPPPSFSSSPQGPPGARPHPSAPAFAPSTGVAGLSPPLRPARGCPLQGLGSRCTWPVLLKSSWGAPWWSSGLNWALSLACAWV